MDERRKLTTIGPVGVWVWQGDITAAGSATAVFALYDRAALERFAPALERALGGGHGA